MIRPRSLPLFETTLMRFFLAAFAVFLGASGLVGCETTGGPAARIEVVDIRVRVIECDRDSLLGAALSEKSPDQSGELFATGLWPKESVDLLLEEDVLVLASTGKMPSREIRPVELVYVSNVLNKSDPLYGRQGGGRLSGFVSRPTGGDEDPERLEIKLNSTHQLNTEGWEISRIEYGGGLFLDDYMLAYRPFVNDEGRELFLVVMVEVIAEE